MLFSCTTNISKSNKQIIFYQTILEQLNPLNVDYYSYLIIRASDDYGLRMVVFYINDQEYKTDPNVSLNSKNFEYRIQVNHGETTVKVNAYNLSEQVSQYEGKYNY